MTQAEKLNLLMNLTNTSNAVLARVVNVDPSHISRLRRGERSMLKRSGYTEKIAMYLARKCCGDFSRKVLYEATMNANIRRAASPEEMAPLLADWICDSADSAGGRLGETTDDFMRFFREFRPSDPVAAPKATGLPPDIEMSGNDIDVFFGDEGKRQAMRVFFGELKRSGQSCDIYLSNDIGFDWVSGEANFTDELGQLLLGVAEIGCGFIRIQEPIRDAGQTFDSVQRWLPLYLKGTVREYVYPGLRDDVLHQTLLVVPGRLCLLATGTGNNCRGGVTFIFHDKRVCNFYAREFRAFLAICRPLNRVYSTADRDKLYKCLTDFNMDEGGCIQKSGQLSLVTMPAEVLRSIRGRTDTALCDRHELWLIEYQQRLENSLRIATLADIINLSDVKDIRAGRVVNPLSYLLGSEQIWYTPQEYRLHLLNMVQLMRSYENYSVLFCRDTLPETHVMCVKECYKALVIKVTDPFAVFEMYNSSIVSASWEYLSRQEKLHGVNSREHVISDLLALADQLI